MPTDLIQNQWYELLRVTRSWRLEWNLEQLLQRVVREAVEEFGATMIFAGNMPGRTETMTLAVYVGFEVDLDQALTLAVILLSTSAIVLYATRAFMAASQDDDD